MNTKLIQNLVDFTFYPILWYSCDQFNYKWMIKIGRLLFAHLLGAPTGRWWLTNVRRMITSSLCTIPTGEFFPFIAVQTPKWPSSFLCWRWQWLPFLFRSSLPEVIKGHQQQSTIGRGSHGLKGRIHWPKLCLVKNTVHSSNLFWISFIIIPMICSSIQIPLETSFLRAKKFASNLNSLKKK